MYRQSIHIGVTAIFLLFLAFSFYTLYESSNVAHAQGEIYGVTNQDAGGQQTTGAGGQQTIGAGGQQSVGAGGQQTVQGQSGGNCPSGQLCNPLNATSITGFLVSVLDVLLVFAVPIIIFFIIYAGFLFVTAQGNASKVETARSALTWAVVGGVIVLGAKILVSVIQNTVSQF